MSLVKRTNQIRAAIEVAKATVGRKDQVTLVGVTKYVDLSTTQALVDAGVRDLGENRADKFLEKYAALKEQDIVWHYIGSLQRRKVKDVVDKIDYFHALDSLSLAQEIQKRATKPLKCFLQVNVSGEASKHGFAPDQLEEVVLTLVDYDKIVGIGLMTMAPLGASPSQLKEIFARLRQLKDYLQEKQLKTMPLTELSMGMSGDFDIAIQEGATFVRLGSSFFD